MNLEANDLLIFSRVAEAGSFSRAGERLHLPKSSVSRRIAALETRLGERLFVRTTRRLALTDFGQSMLEVARRIAEEVDAASVLAESRQAEPGGHLRISMPADFAAFLLPGMLAEFVRRYPRINLSLDLSPRRVDLIGENFDLAIRMGDLPDDATLAARRICDFQPGLVATPAYLKARGVPEHPDELFSHNALRLLMRTGEPAPTRLMRGSERWEGVLSGQISVNSLGMLIRLVQEDMGLAQVDLRFVAQNLAQGELVQVLPEWQAPRVTAWAVMPSRRLISTKTRVFVDALQACLAA